MIKVKKENRGYPGVAFITPSGLSEKEARAYTRSVLKEYDEAGEGLNSFERDGIKLMRSLKKLMDEMEKKDLEDSIYMMRQAEFMVANWLNAINPSVTYKISR
jgi:hypothetical protein